MGNLDFKFTSINNIGQGFLEDKYTPVEVLHYFLNRIEKYDSELKSYATVMRVSALEAAEIATNEISNGKYRGPLHGIPIAVKDLCYTKGIKTMGGTAVLQDFIPDYDSTVVSNLKQAGAIILGKLNLTEGAMGGYNPKRDIPRNPWASDRWPGSSSSGSGAATAKGLCVASLGSDTGGSIRFPSASCGIVGIKPTYGRVSRHGVLDLAESLDHVGPMANSVIDGVHVLNAISGRDPSDLTSLSSTPLRLENISNIDLSDFTLGYDEIYASKGVNPNLASLVKETLEVFTSNGAKIREIKMPKNIDSFLPAWKTLCTAEAYHAHRDFFPTKSDEYGPWFRSWLSEGEKVTTQEYLMASIKRRECNALVKNSMEEVDAVISPAMINFPHYVDDSIGYGPMDDKRGTAFQRFTVPYDFNGYPTVTLPCGFSPEGLPGSVQIIGKPFSEETISRIANAFEQSTDWNNKHPMD